MPIQDYTPGTPLGEGPCGARFRAIDEAGRAVEIRLLDLARADESQWATLVRRFRLLDLIAAPARLLSIETDLSGEQPFLVLPAHTERSGRFQGDVRLLLELFAAAHRVGVSLGPLGREHLHLDPDGNPFVDLTMTRPTHDSFGHEPLSESADVAAVGMMLAAHFDTTESQWVGIIAKMLSPNPADRPTFAEIIAPIERLLSATVESIHPVSEPPPVGRIPRAGDDLGRFRLVEKLGEGAMGVVFRAVDRLDGSVAAVKVLRPERALSFEARRRFLKEARILGEIDSPFVTRLLDANTEGDCLYLALEFVSGSDVGVLLRDRKKLDESLAVGIVRDAARGLAVAHERGIVHRDVKPENILLEAIDETQRARMTDFGLARSVDQSQSMDMTLSGVFLGTPLYMAPELFDGTNASSRSDVYALGATLFHLLTGRPPFEAKSLEALMLKHLRESPPDVSQIVPETTPALAIFVSKCLSKSPEDRPADAAMFLRQLERALQGDPAGVQAHPRLPEATGSPMERVYEWSLAASPRQLWPYVSNTERLNRAIGLPPVGYVFRPDPVMGTRRFATAKVFGLALEWEEHPFEWVEEQRFGVLREFTRGPFRWFMSIVDLIPKPEGGTLLRQTVRVEPRGWFSGLLARVELGFNTPRSLQRVYRRIDSLLSSATAQPLADAFEITSALSGARRQRLDLALGRLIGSGVRPELAEALGAVLRSASPLDLARIRPLALARGLGVDPSALADACLRAVGCGLLKLHWDIICPTCRIAADRKDTLQELRDHENCSACDVAFATDFASVVELVFESHPEIRPAEAGRYCAGGPAHSPHVVAQARVGAGERLELELRLTAGAYRIRGPRLPWVANLQIVAGGGGRTVQVDLADSRKPSVPALSAGEQVVLLVNERDHEVIVRIERSAGRDDALTAAQATALPAFRELFPGELLSPGRLARASSITLLLVRVGDGSAWYARLGEARAFAMLQEAIRRLEEAIRKAGGSLVKVVDETVYAAFPDVAQAVRTALSLPAILAEGETVGLEIRASVQRGLVMVATINNRLDYFGSTVKQAAMLLTFAGAGELILPTSVGGDAEVLPLLAERSRRIASVNQGDGKALIAYRVGL